MTLFQDGITGITNAKQLPLGEDEG